MNNGEIKNQHRKVDTGFILIFRQETALPAYVNLLSLLANTANPQKGCSISSFQIREAQPFTAIPWGAIDAPFVQLSMA
jgi:hypothetical protein